jgi:hypothetical protein
MPEPEAASRDGASDPNRDLPAERRDTESAIRLWHQKATAGGGLPSLSTFDFSRLASERGYRFLISGDEFVGASVFLVYGMHFARLLALPEQPRSKSRSFISFLHGIDRCSWKGVVTCFGILHLPV